MDFQGKSDKELVEDSDIGVRGLGALVEIMRRLKDSIEKLDSSNRIYADKLTILTLVLILIGFSQLFIGAMSTGNGQGRTADLALASSIFLLAWVIFWYLGFIHRIIFWLVMATFLVIWIGLIALLVL